MNKKLKLCITVILVCMFTYLCNNEKYSIAYGEDNFKKYLEEQKSEMDTMMEEMKNIKPTGDAAIDFLYGMIPHHKAAVEMSKSLLKYGGNNPELKNIAENIITNQTKEIEQMQDMIKLIGVKLTINEKKEQEYLKEYYNMLNESMNHKYMDNAKSVDMAFAIGMIKHHEMAISMSKIILNYTDNQEVIDLANSIIKSQNEEVKKMKDIIINS